MTFAQAGMLSAASTLTYALGQIPAGYLSDRFGPKRLFFIGILGSTVLSLSFGLIQAFQLAVINQLVAGVFRALMFAPGLALMASWFPPERRATAMGLYVVGGFSGNILLSLVGPVLTNHYGWRFTIIFFSVVGMGAAFTVMSNALGGYVSDRLKNPPLVIGGSLAAIACTSTLLVLVDSIPALLVVVAINSIFPQFYFGALFAVPIEVLGQRVAGMSTGFSNLFANIGALTFAYALGVVKDQTGTFTWGFVGISAACVVGVVLAFALARVRSRALARPDRETLV